MLSEGIHAKIQQNSYVIPPIFEMLQKDGDIEEQIMYNTYNMGLGMIIGVDSKDADKAVRLIEEAGEKAYIVGEAVSGTKGVSLC
jgi:phosphoribosylformylglycinamidine cyclo-ligase